jgi:hypothetical protein
MNEAWWEALNADRARRDREAALARAVALAQRGELPAFDELTPEEQRRLGYLVELGQMLRGQTIGEGELMTALRTRLGPLDSVSFWPGEKPVPPGTDPVAERWNYQRGCDVLRLRRAIQGELRMAEAASAE